MIGICSHVIDIFLYIHIHIKDDIVSIRTLVLADLKTSFSQAAAFFVTKIAFSDFLIVSSLGTEVVLKRER